jgi:hypothetical protein
MYLRIAEKEVVVNGIVVIAHQAIPYILPVDEVVQWMVFVDVPIAVYQEMFSEVSASVPALEVSLVTVLKVLTSLNANVCKLLN